MSCVCAGIGGAFPIPRNSFNVILSTVLVNLGRKQTTNQLYTRTLTRLVTTLKMEALPAHIYMAHRIKNKLNIKSKPSHSYEPLN
jgi:hypothetical protein